MTEYQMNLVRMWDSLRNENKGEPNCRGVSCRLCPLNKVVCTDGDFIAVSYNAEKAIEILNSWVKEHPIFTNADKFEEVWGFKPIHPDGTWYCPSIYKGIECHNITNCEKCSSEFWLSEYKEPKKEGD